MDKHALNDLPISMHDGTTPHTMRISQDFLHDAIIVVILWQAKAPILISLGNRGHM